MTQAFNTQRFS